jgi:tRNA uridine 5-carboxymethylaminomethyl modification enzyme
MGAADAGLHSFLSKYTKDAIEEAEILMKYEGYIQREQENAEKVSRLEELRIQPDFNYRAISSLGAEALEKLIKHRPSTIGQASRISGISPADISVLLVHMGR